MRGKKGRERRWADKEMSMEYTHDEACKVPRLALIAPCDAGLTDELVDKWVDDRGCYGFGQLKVQQQEEL